MSAANAAGALPNRRRIAGNFLALAVTSVLGLVVTIVISICVRRALGPAAIGQVSWAQAAIAYLTGVVTLGVTTVGQRELAKHPGRADELLALILTLQTVLAVLVYGVVVAIAAFEPRGAVVSLLLLIQGLTLFLTAWNTGWVLQASERMVAPSIAVLAFNTLQLPALLLLIHQPDDIYLYALLGLPFALLGVLYNLWYIQRHHIARPLRLRLTLAGAWPLLREAWPLALMQGAILTTLNGATLILGFTDGDEAVGQYATAFRLMMVATVVTAALWNAYFPALARAHNSPAQATSLSREYLGLLAWMGLPIAALGWAAGRHVVDLMYGPAFAASGAYFEWLCLYVGLNFINYGISAVFVPWGYNVLAFKIAAVAALVNLALNLAAIPLLGPWGAIVATVGSETVVLVIGIAVRKRRGIFRHPILPIVAPPLICSTAVALAIVALPPSFHRYWWLEILAGATVLVACGALFERHVVVKVMRGVFVGRGS